MRRKDGRVLGPYRERNGKWRIVAIHSNGFRVTRTYSSKDKARRAMESALIELRSRLLLEPQVRLYLQTMIDRGLAATTIKETGALLLMMFENETAAMWNPGRVTETLAIWGRRWSVATRRVYLARCRQFWAWMLKQHKVLGNPFEGVEIEGRPNRGKPQLRLDEARKLVEISVALAAQGLRLALAPVIALTMGLRASEIVKRVVRDLDDGGRLLWIPSGKTVNARRTLEVPESLQPLLAELVAGRHPDEPLFGLNSRGNPWRRQQFHELLQDLCRLAGVPKVCPHSLRGLWATLAVRSGAACEAVARILGHGSFQTTARHYAKPEALEGARNEQAGDLLFRK